MMIKEKDCFEITGQESFEYVLKVTSENEVLECLEKAFNKSNIPVMLEMDEIQFKTGVMKKTSSRCIVISSKEKGDKYSKFILYIVKEGETGPIKVLNTWNGESESSILLKKINKSIDKFNKNIDKTSKGIDQSSDITGMLAKKLKGSIKGKMISHKQNKLQEQFEEAKRGELEYYDSVYDTVNKALNSLK